MNLTRKTVVGIVSAFVACVCWLPAGADTAKPLRSMRYSSRSADQAIAWRKDLRTKIAALLKIDDLLAAKTPIPFNPKTLSSENRGKYVLREVEINSTKTRRMRFTLTLPTNLKGPFPAVVAIGGHSSTRLSCYDGPADGGYYRFAHILAGKGYVTISRRVSQHRAFEKGRTPMGERLWDLMRCVDFLASLKQVDAKRIGCAGLSLGGEMAMWLGAMDQRMRATVSSGFLTTMDQLEKNHCMCWKFAGLRDLADFADIYAMTAPRALLCQNGLKERPMRYHVPIARRALKEIQVAYADFKQPENLAFIAHKGGHEIDLPSLLTFFDKHLGSRAEAKDK
jgi:dienelactone hydrolase